MLNPLRLGRLIKPTIALLAVLALVACGGRAQLVPDVVVTQSGVGSPAGNEPAIWPVALPHDIAQPWDAPADSKGGTGILTGSEFLAGYERWAEAGGVVDSGEASSISTGAGELSFAIYRVAMGGEQPGAVSLDVNLKENNSETSECYVGLSNYGTGSWDWHGPYTDGRAIISVPAGTYTSGLGNTFVTLLAFDGASFDVIGIGVDATDAADTDAPPAPAAPLLTPVADGLQLDWLAVPAGDLAGYRIYFDDTNIAAAPGADVPRVDYLEGTTQHVLTGLGSETYVRIAAVDVSGNSSALSPEAAAIPLTGSAPSINITVDEHSGLLGYTATLSATGAATYDWDLDGDGVYEVVGDATGTQPADTNRIGVIRPRVMGHDGISRKTGAVSLLVSGNQRPVCSAYATPASGDSPLSVTFDSVAEDFDGSITNYAWDFNSDQTWDYETTVEADRNPPAQVFTNPGTYNVKFRVTDDDGSWDVDTVTVTVEEEPAPINNVPTADFFISFGSFTAPAQVYFNPALSSDSDGSIVKYEWDFEGDGAYDRVTYSNMTVSHLYTTGGSHWPTLRVTDDRGAASVVSREVKLYDGWFQDGGGPHRTRFHPTAGPATNNIEYSADVTTEFVSQPPVIAQDGSIFLVDSSGDLFSLYPDLTTRWSISIGAGNSEIGPALGRDGLIYVGENDGIVRCLNQTGTPVWDRDLSTVIRAIPLLDPDQNRLYVLAEDGSLFCLDSQTGVPLWDSPYDGGDVAGSQPTLGLGGSVMFATVTGQLHCVGPDGTDVWPPYDNGNGAASYSTPAYDPVTATVVCCFANGFTHNQGIVFKLDAITGAELWSVALGTGTSQIDAPPAIGPDGTVYVGTWDDNLYALSGADGSVLPGWPFATGNDIDSCGPVVDGSGRVYIGSWDNKVYCVDTATGVLIWESAASTALYDASMALGPAGRLYAVNAFGEFTVFRD